MTRHRIRRWLDLAGWNAACACGWRTRHHTRELRDEGADAHVLAAAAGLESPTHETPRED